MIIIKVDNKVRVVRNSMISLHTDTDLYCKYRGYNICISEQEAGDYYVTAVDKTGSYLVQGGYGGRYCRYGIDSIEDCLVMVIKNIVS